MTIKLETFTIGETTYFPERRWSSVSAKLQGSPPAQHLAVSPCSSFNLFVANTCMGFIVCEDYLRRNMIFEVTTQGMVSTSMDFSPSEEVPLVVISFTLGQILVIDPIKRRKGILQWFNPCGSLYSEGAPTVSRWIDSHNFIVLFEDNCMWVFDRSSTGEDKRKISEFQNSGDSRQLAHFEVFEDKKGSNPRSLWKFHLRTVTDVRFSRKSVLGFKTMLVCTSDGQVKLYNYSGKQSLMTFYSYFGGFHTVSMNSDCSVIAAAGEDDSVSVWSVESPQLLARCIGHRAWSCALSFGPDGLLYSAGIDGRLLAWGVPQATSACSWSAEHIPYSLRSDIPLQESIFDLAVSSEPLSGLAVKENRVFVCDVAGNIIMWRSRTK